MALHLSGCGLSELVCLCLSGCVACVSVGVGHVVCVPVGVVCAFQGVWLVFEVGVV